MPCHYSISFPKLRSSMGAHRIHKRLWLSSMDFTPNFTGQRRQLTLPTFQRTSPSPNWTRTTGQSGSEAKVLEVIKNLKQGSAPGPDGLSACYFNTFRSSLSTYLTRFFNSLWTGSKMYKAANKTYIYIYIYDLSVVPKPGKDSSEAGNYISLINNDL